MITENLVCTPEMPEMPEGRDFPLSVYVGGKVFSCGGLDDGSPAKREKNVLLNSFHGSMARSLFRRVELMIKCESLIIEKPSGNSTW